MNCGENRKDRKGLGPKDQTLVHIPERDSKLSAQGSLTAETAGLMCQRSFLCF